MYISLELPQARLRRWHLWLIDQLKERDDCAVNVTLHDNETSVPSALSLLLQIERLTQRHRTNCGVDLIPQTDVAAFTTSSLSAPDLVIRLGADAPARNRKATHPTLTLTFDGVSNENALWDALLHRRAPQVSAVFHAAGETARANSSNTILPAIDSPHRLLASADAVMSRAIELIVHHVHQGSDARTATNATTSETDVENTQSAHFQSQHLSRATSGFIARRVRDKAQSVLSKIIKTAPQWQVAWRARQPLQPDRATQLSLSTFHLLPDDGQRYFADPFPIEHKGTPYLFIEEYPYATERGIISVATIDSSGRASTPRPVLETKTHLSYPQVFAHEGAMCMLPEASESGGVDLYRATDFPGGWTQVARLIDEPLHDATLYQDDAGWWLFAASTFLKSSSWCALKVYYADDLLGPWHPIQADPAKVDARSSRPAGSLVMQDGTLWRPTQDCSTGYGHGLTWCCIDTLTRTSYAETAIGSMRFDADNILGPHTWTATNAIETLDVFAASQMQAPPKP